MDEITELCIKKILNYAEEYGKSDNHIYRVIFNELSNNGKNKNYSHNKNGVFFNISAFDYNVLKSLEEKISIFLQKKDDNVKIEIKRETLVTEYNSTIKIPENLKKELKTFLNHETNALSTKISGDDVNTEVVDKTLDTKRKPSKKIIKPKVLKGVYERIYKNLHSRWDINNRRFSVNEKLYSEQEKNTSDHEELEKEETDDEETEAIIDDKELEKELFGSDTSDDDNDSIVNKI